MKKQTIYKVIWSFLFLSFMALYFTQAPEYMENKLNEKTIVTDELTKQFESDIASGKEIDLNDYIVPIETFNNNISDASYNLSRGIVDFVTNGLESLFSTVSKTVNN